MKIMPRNCKALIEKKKKRLEGQWWNYYLVPHVAHEHVRTIRSSKMEEL
jgi:hypothetical protein